MAVIVKGLDDALRRLDALRQPQLDRASRKVVMAAARSLVRPMRTEVRSSVAGHGKTPGQLERSISARKGKRMPYPSAIVGPRTSRRGAFYRHMVIGGTKPHVIKAKKGALAFGGRFATEVQHPGSRPNPFVERSVRGQERRIEEFVQRQLEKELNTWRR
jgi:hypothetical protein